MSSNKAHGLIYLPRPFIPTITPWNSTLLLPGKKGDFDITAMTLLCSYVIPVCAGVSSTVQKHAFDVSAFGTRLHLFFATPYSLRSMVQWRSNGGRFYGDLGWNSPTCFPLSYIYIYIYMAWRLRLFHFLHFQISRTSLKSHSFLL